MQRRLCEMSEAKWSITEAKCLQISHNKYASQRDAISHSMGNLMLSHSAGMHNTDKSIAGISKRFHFASLHYIFSAYLPTHIKFLTEFHRIFFGTTCISLPKNKHFHTRGLEIRFWSTRSVQTILNVPSALIISSVPWLNITKFIRPNIITAHKSFVFLQRKMLFSTKRRRKSEK